MAFTHGRKTVVYGSGYDLTTYLNQADVAADADLAETSAFGSTYKSFVAGLIDGKMSFGGLYDGSAGAVDAALAPLLAGDIYLAVLPQGDVAAARGRAMYGSEVSYGIKAGIGGPVAITVEASSHSGVEAVVVDTIKGAKLATGNDATGVVSPTGAATTGGWAAYLHCFAMAGTAAPTCAVKLQDSPDGSSWLDVADGAFVTLSAANANVPGGQRIRSLVVAGTPPTEATLRKFTRFLWTITGTNPSFTIWAGHVRY